MAMCAVAKFRRTELDADWLLKEPEVECYADASRGNSFMGFHRRLYKRTTYRAGAMKPNRAKFMPSADLERQSSVS